MRVLYQYHGLGGVFSEWLVMLVGHGAILFWDEHIFVRYRLWSPFHSSPPHINRIKHESIVLIWWIEWRFFPAITQRWGNVMTTLSLVRSDTALLQYYHNVEDECYIPTLWQRCHNVGITLWQCCHNVRKLHNFAKLPQHCYNVENNIISQHSHKMQAMMQIQQNYNIQTMLWQHCLNIVCMLWAG